MIYTVTLNPAVDISIHVKKTLKSGGVNKSTSMRTDPGGKGVNVSKTLKVLGRKSVICTAICGDDGEAFLGMLKAMGFEVICVRYPVGNTRTNVKITGDDGITTEINGTGPFYDKATVESLKTQIRERLVSGDIVVLSGSPPVGSPLNIYAGFINSFQEVEGIKIILDASGRYLREGLSLKPYAVKPSSSELGIENDPEIAMEEARNIIAQGIERCVVSMGDKGAVYADGVVDALYSEALAVKVSSTIGCGDAMTAGLAYAANEKLKPSDTFRLCMALAGAEAETEGTNPPQRKRVKELMKAMPR